MCVYLSLSLPLSLSLYIYISISVCMCVYMYVCVCICMYVYSGVLWYVCVCVTTCATIGVRPWNHPTFLGLTDTEFITDNNNNNVRNVAQMQACKCQNVSVWCFVVVVAAMVMVYRRAGSCACAPTPVCHRPSQPLRRCSFMTQSPFFEQCFLLRCVCMSLGYCLSQRRKTQHPADTATRDLQCALK